MLGTRHVLRHGRILIPRKIWLSDEFRWKTSIPTTLLKVQCIRPKLTPFVFVRFTLKNNILYERTRTVFRNNVAKAWVFYSTFATSYLDSRVYHDRVIYARHISPPTSKFGSFVYVSFSMVLVWPTPPPFVWHAKTSNKKNKRCGLGRYHHMLLLKIKIF